MDPDFERKYHAFEDTYWWFRARRECVARLMQQRLKIGLDAEILEVGCSGGPLLELLKHRGYRRLVGVDLSPVAIERCKARGLSDVHVMDAIEPALEPGRFDLVIASDVLEHLSDPARALTNWHRLLKPGGKLIVFVPAFMFLWSEHDVVNRHFRRYTGGGLKHDLRTAGFHLRMFSYWNTGLFPAVAAVRVAKKLLPKSGDGASDQLVKVNPAINSVLLNWMRVENRLLAAGIFLPAGVSVMVVGDKPNATS
jgi:SAM-dependent methyltransferase